MKKISILAYDPASLPGVAGVLEILTIANNMGQVGQPGSDPLMDCQVISPVRGSQKLSNGLTFEFESGLDTPGYADVVIVPGFVYGSIDELLAKVDISGKTTDWLKRQYYNGAIIGGSCSGTVLLAESGLLDGKPATTSWWLASTFRKRYPGIDLKIDRLLVESGRVLSSGAVTSYFNLVLRLIELCADKALASLCSKMILIESNRSSQAPFMMLQSESAYFDDLVTKAQHFIQSHLQQKIDLQELASQMAVSYRTLIRRFKSATGDSPKKYLQKVRVETAKRLLETTDFNLETIIERVGYQDVSSFSILFKRFTELTPREYRMQFAVGKD